VLLRDLGTEFRGEALSYKPYPCGRPLHAAIDAALAARAQLGIAAASDIAAVTIEADPAGHADQFESGPTKRRPSQVVEAQLLRIVVGFGLAAAITPALTLILELTPTRRRTLITSFFAQFAAAGSTDRPLTPANPADRGGRNWRQGLPQSRRCLVDFTRRPMLVQHRPAAQLMTTSPSTGTIDDQ